MSTEAEQHEALAEILENSVFGGIPKDAQLALLSATKLRKLPANALLMKEGAPSQSLFLVQSGRLQIVKDGYVIDEMEQPGVLGEMGLLTGEPRSATLRCVSDVIAGELEARAFFKTLEEHPSIMQHLFFDLVSKMRTSQVRRVDQQTALADAESMLDKIVSPAVREQVLKQADPEELLRGTLVDSAILFYDIQGFSSIAEQIGPAELLQTLNAHLTHINDAVEQYGGTIVNYIGDAVLAIFNTPVKIAYPSDAAFLAFRAARARLAKLSEELEEQGLRAFQLRAGIHQGEIVAGAIGSHNRFNFTVLGNAVNLTARLEGLTRHYPVEVILSGDCYEQLSPEAREHALHMDRITAKGLTQPLDIFTIADLSEQHRQQYEAALDKYLAGDFTEAAVLFSIVGLELADHMQQRSTELAVSTDKWPGYFAWNEK